MVVAAIQAEMERGVTSDFALAMLIGGRRHRGHSWVVRDVFFRRRTRWRGKVAVLVLRWGWIICLSIRLTTICCVPLVVFRLNLIGLDRCSSESGGDIGSLPETLSPAHY